MAASLAACVSRLVVFLVILKCAHSHYTATWAVHVPGGVEAADAVARDHGFVNLGEVSNAKWNFFKFGLAAANKYINFVKELEIFLISCYQNFRLSYIVISSIYLLIIKR